MGWDSEGEEGAHVLTAQSGRSPHSTVQGPNFYSLKD